MKADNIGQVSTNIDYRGLKDNMYDKIFHGIYQKEITSFKPDEIFNEYQKKFLEREKQSTQLQGKFNYQKVYFAKLVSIRQFFYAVAKKNNFFKSITHHLPDNFNFVTYQNVWPYQSSAIQLTVLTLDFLAQVKGTDYSVLVEVKNRTIQKFSQEEAIAF